jgi:hypothetical protein
MVSVALTQTSHTKMLAILPSRSASACSFCLRTYEKTQREIGFMTSKYIRKKLERRKEEEVCFLDSYVQMKKKGCYLSK